MYGGWYSSVKYNTPFFHSTEILYSEIIWLFWILIWTTSWSEKNILITTTLKQYSAKSDFLTWKWSKIYPSICVRTKTICWKSDSVVCNSVFLLNVFTLKSSVVKLISFPYRKKIKSKNSLRQKPIEHWKQLEQIPSYILQVN